LIDARLIVAMIHRCLIKLIVQSILSIDNLPTISGKKNVNITCVNFVSSNILLTVIDAQPVVLDDYTFEYQHIVPASMTSDSEYIPVVVNFIVHLFECVRFSPNVGCGLICNAGIGYCTAILYW
jgi:hypothetical protein